MTGVTETAAYPVGLDLAGRRVVVVGGGTVAYRRLPGLLAAGADVVLVAARTTPGIDPLVAAGRLRLERRSYRPGDLAEAWYCLALTDDPQVNAAVAAEAEQRRIFCVRADAGERGSARTPATGRHEQLTIAVLSGDPRRSAGLRDRIVEELRVGTLTAPHHRPGPERPGSVTLVGGGPGDPDLITVAGRRALAQADVVVADRLAPARLLDELAPDVELVDAAKLPYGRSMSQPEINRILIDRARAGLRVVRLKGGDPFVFGRGFEEIQACAAAGVPTSVIPGVSSSVGVPALAGIPVTHRGVAHGFTVVAGHLDPADPDSLVDWSALATLAAAGQTLVLLMGVERLERTVASLLTHGLDPATPAAAVQNGSTAGERVVRATLDQLAEAVAADGLTAPAVVVVGAVAGLDLD